jgi:glutathione peroxidase
MKILVIVIVLALLTAACWKFNVIGGTTVIAQTADPAVKTTALSHVVKDIDGKDFDLATLKGKVVLIVNVASKCGFTPQYKGLEALYVKYKDKGLVIVGFPANDFGSQEPGTDAEIKQFCSSKYDVTFPMMSKIVVTGADKHPVYKDLTEGTGKFSGEIGWNFTKFLIARDGETILARFASKTAPGDEQVTKAVEDALGK